MFLIIDVNVPVQFCRDLNNYLNQSEMFGLGRDVWCMYTHHAHISSIAFGGRNTTMFHNPLKRSPFLSSITTIVPKSPCTVNQHLLGQWCQLSRLKERERQGLVQICVSEVKHFIQLDITDIRSLNNRLSLCKNKKKSFNLMTASFFSFMKHQQVIFLDSYNRDNKRFTEF